MVTNLLKKYPDFLDLVGLTEASNRPALYPVYSRDFINSVFPLFFLQKPVLPTPKEGEAALETLYRHLTTTITDKATKKREFESARSCRLHWVRFHIDLTRPNDVLIFSTIDSEGPRTYIYDKTCKYVIVLEPLRNRAGYYLLSAYYLRGGDGKKIENKWKRRLRDVL